MITKLESNKVEVQEIVVVGFRDTRSKWYQAFMGSTV